MDKWRSSNSNGATLVEFALIFPAFLLLIFGILYFGIYLFTQQSVQNAAQQGVNAAIAVDVDSAGKGFVRDRVNARVASALSFMPGQIDDLQMGAVVNGRCGAGDDPGYVCVTNSGNDGSYDVVVRLQPKFSSLWPGFPKLLPFLTGGDAESGRLEARAHSRLTSRSRGGAS